MPKLIVGKCVEILRDRWDLTSARVLNVEIVDCCADTCNSLAKHSGDASLASHSARLSKTCKVPVCKSNTTKHFAHFNGSRNRGKPVKYA